MPAFFQAWSTGIYEPASPLWDVPRTTTSGKRSFCHLPQEETWCSLCSGVRVVLLNVWNGPFSDFAALNLPTCHWLGCSRALKPRRRASSAALVDEPGSDGPWVDCTLRTLCPRHSIKSSALREESGSGSLARGRP